MIATETKQLMRMILAGWPTQRAKLTDDDLAAMGMIYHAGLSDLDFEVCKSAVTRMVRTSTFMPSVAEIRAAAGVIVHGERVIGAEAWGSVVKAMKEQGSHRTPGVDFWFRDPITERVVKALNWSELCGGEADKNAADRARFIDAYNDIADRERVAAAATTGGKNPMLEARRAPPDRALPASAAILTAQDRADTLRKVLAEARDLNKHLGPEIQALIRAVEPKALPPEDERCHNHGFERDMEDICMKCGAPADGPPGRIRPYAYDDAVAERRPAFRCKAEKCGWSGWSGDMPRLGEQSCVACPRCNTPFTRFECDSCGIVTVDEDGLCKHCGAGTTVVAVTGIQ